MMGTYLMMLYVSLEQEVAVKQLFTTKGWGYNKPDLRMMTGDIGPLMEETMQTKVVTHAPSQDILQTQPVLQSPQELVLTQTSEQVSRQINQIMEQSNYCHEMPSAQALSDIPKQQDQQSAEEAKRPKRTPKRNPKYFEKTEVDTKSAKKTSKPRTVKSHPKVEVDTDKSNKSVQENAEFQEILQEAEIIAASLSNIETENYEDHKTPVPENETDSVETGQFQVKIEQYADDDDITDFDTQVNDNTVENTETDNVPSCSNETEEVSAGPSGSRTSSAKKRKMTGKIVASQGETKMELASYSSTNISTNLTSTNLTSTDIASTDLTRPNRSNKAYKLEKSAELMYICQACGYKSNQKSNLLRHERIQHGNERFDCARCNKTYRSPATLKSHLLSHDSPEICESCGKKFSSKAGLKFHINKVHLSVANFECPICKKLFQTSTDFDGHMNAHKGYKPYSCPTCIKSFSYRSSLTSHMKHCSRAASHSCKSCDSVFKTETLLAQHMLGKHGEQVFTCACGKCFKWKTSMHRHQNTCPVSVSSPD